MGYLACISCSPWFIVIYRICTSILLQGSGKAGKFVNQTCAEGLTRKILIYGSGTRSSMSK